jgi:hypothetical protein
MSEGNDERERTENHLRHSKKSQGTNSNGTCLDEVTATSNSDGIEQRFRCSGKTDERGNSTEHPNCTSGGIIRLLIEANIKQEANLHQQLDDTVQNRLELQKLLDSLREFNE